MFIQGKSQNKAICSTLYVLSFGLFAIEAHGANPPVRLSGTEARNQLILGAVDPKGMKHWIKWRDQHSTIDFLHDWRVKTGSTPDGIYLWKHLSVQVYKTPGAKLHKTGQQAILKIFDGHKLLYCSDRLDEYQDDELCDEEPLSVFSLDNDKVCVTSQARAAVTISIFAYKNGKVRKVLARGSYTYPELIYPRKIEHDNSNLYHKVIICELMDGQVPIAAGVFTWNNKNGSYSRKERPFGKRFD